jgi:pyruvate dehydrogenase kinase 2/3/4
MAFESSTLSDQATLAQFCQTLKMVQARHANVVQTMAQGVLELKESHPVDNQMEMSIQYFLDRFYMSRISMRMLMQQVKSKISTSPELNKC